MARKKTANSIVGLSQFGPQVLNAGFFQFEKAMEFRYELKLHHLILVERGQLDASTPSGPVCAKAGDLLCFRPSLDMIYRVTPETAFYQASVQFLPPPNHLLTPELPEAGLIPIQTPTGEAVGHFRGLFESICVELPQAGSPHHFRVQVSVFKILALLAETLAGSSRPPLPLDAWERIHLRVASIEGGGFSPARLAQELGVSERHFQRVFKQRFGMSPGTCRMRARLGEAVRRLRETDEPVKSISYSLGFDGAKGLTFAMKKHLGLTASQLRFDPETGSKSLAILASHGLFPGNTHILPPTDRLDLFWARVTVSEREM